MHDIGPFSTATEMLAALDAKAVSSTELVEMHLQRIERVDPAINAIPVRTADRARAAATAADAARARGERAALLGLPITLKESTQTAGLPQSAGIEFFRDHTPAADGTIARDVTAAGACLLGKTNIPVALGDWQADSPIYGRTLNPWDTARTPGGSTGGGGAALAAGLTPLEIGSDIGGSIRVPAAYCGVYGHRPSETAVPRTGAFPMADLPSPAALLGVQGPLARSAADLALLLDVVAGPDLGEDTAWQLHLPAPRAERLSDLRVALMPSTELATPSRAMQAALADVATTLRAEGARVAEAMPEFDLRAYFHDYFVLLNVMTSPPSPPDAREAQAAALRATGDAIALATAEGLTLSAADFQMLLRRRAAAQATWRAFFTEWDVLLCPTALDAAFEHVSGPQSQRTLRIDDSEVPYLENIIFPMLPIHAGLPATAFPAGLDQRGLPLGLQAIGPYLEDRTTIRVAELLEQAWHGFVPPPAFRD